VANLKEVRIRIASINSTQQITKAMKLVSATKLRRAQNSILQMRPYAQKLNGILANLAGTMEVDSLKALFTPRKDTSKILLVVITSDRGLCGSFNANVIKLAARLASEKYAGKNITILPVGKKGAEYFSRQSYPVVNDFKDTFQDLSAKSGFEIGQHILNQFTAGRFDKVELVYNQFKNAATQILTAEQFLPIDPASLDTTNADRSSRNEYIFEPSAGGILETLIPQILKTQVYRSLLDSLASEHGARMIAMDKATDNAGELLKALKIEYNRVRQAAITTEISEIVGGAAALSGQ
jgi:F-type H+-transporting ATPase subunit gamma